MSIVANMVQFHLDIQEDHLKAGIKPWDSGYGREPSERYGKPHSPLYSIPNLMNQAP